jgi:hypothetical protein
MTKFPFNCDTNVRMNKTFKQDFVHCEAAACRPDLRNALASACSFATATASCPADMASSCLIFLFKIRTEANDSITDNGHVKATSLILNCQYHGLRTPNEGINQRYLKNWADVADKICFGRT